jgi:hypothetical protein
MKLGWIYWYDWTACVEANPLVVEIREEIVNANMRTLGSLLLLAGFYRYLYANDENFPDFLELTIVKAFLCLEILAYGNIVVCKRKRHQTCRQWVRP